MHAERDHLRNVVFPALEERLRSRRLHLEPIDLRLGVETVDVAGEPEKELRVLKVCLDEIERSRPFLIVLLGERYGWVPPEELMAAATREAGFQTPLAGKSVTALEIEFGLLKKDPSQRERCFLYFRDPLQLANQPPEIIAQYSDAASGSGVAHGRLEALKAQLQADPVLGSRVRRYAANWDGSKVVGLDAWGAQVLQDLWGELDLETHAFAGEINPSWEVQEWEVLQEFIEHSGLNFTGRSELLRALVEHARSAPVDGVPWGICITGAPGTGKSALFARVCHRLAEDPGVVLLAHAAGISPRASTVDGMLRRWIVELGGAPPSDNSSEALESAFAELLAATSVNRRVVVVIDALNQFEPAPRAQHLTWLPKSWPPNARLITTSQPGSESAALSQRSGVQTHALAALDPASSREIAVSVCRRYHREFHPQVLATILSKRGVDGPAAGNPLWLTLAMEELNLLDADDFARADRVFEGTPEQRLHQMVLDVATRLPPDVEGLYEWMLRRNEIVCGEAWAKALACTLALSRFGWREQDLRRLVPAAAGLLVSNAFLDGWDDLKLATLRRGFRAHLLKRGTIEQFDFRHEQMRLAIRRRNLDNPAMERSLHLLIVAYLSSLASPDPIADSELMHHLIGAGDLWLAARYYGGALSPVQESAANAIVATYLLSGPSPQNDNPLEWVLLLPRQGSPEDRAGTAGRFLSSLDEVLSGRAAQDIRLALLRSSEAVYAELVALDQPKRDWLRGFVISEMRVGDLLRTQSAWAEALVTYRAGLALAERLAVTDPEDWLIGSDIAIAHGKIGELLERQGDYPAALEEYLTAEKHIEDLVVRLPSEHRLRRELAGWQLAVARVLRRQGEMSGAITRCRAAVDVLESLATSDSAGPRPLSDPMVVSVRRDLFVARHEIAGLLQSLGDLEGALENHQMALSIATSMASRDPANRRWQDDLATGHSSMAGILSARGALSEALQSAQIALSIAQRLEQADPTNTDLQESLADSHQQVADLLVALQLDAAGALASYKAALLMRQHLMEADPGNTQWKRAVAVTCYRLARFCQLIGDHAGITQFAETCHQILAGMQSGGISLDPTSQRMLVQVRSVLAGLSGQQS
jgi:tetratricopeptide (TPR) repeat protein